MVAIILAIVVGGFLLSTGTSVPKNVTFRDPVGDFTITYPGTWKAYSGDDPSIRMLLRVTPQSLDSVELRVTRLDSVIDTSNLAYLKSFTDAALSGSHPVVTDQGPITVNGTPGYYYVYTFTDSASGQLLVHLRYFLFQGHKMNSLILQATAKDLNGLATQFKEIKDSFHSNPEKSPTGAPSTTAPH